MPNLSDNIDISIKQPSPPCPICLAKIKESYNIFTECNICGYGLNREIRESEDEIKKSAKEIRDGKIIEINTFYGTYRIGKPSSIINNRDFTILAYDLATIKRYAHIEDYELNALASIEKPTIRVKKSMKFTIDYEDIEDELIKFRLADDAILYLLMEELHTLGEDTIFISKDSINSDNSLSLIEPQKELEPLEIVTSKSDIYIISGERGLSKIEEDLSLTYQNIAILNLDRDMSSILVQGNRFGTIEYLSFNCQFSSIEDIFFQISDSNEEGRRLVENYKNKFPQTYSKVAKISFEDSRFSIYRLWGVIAIILDFVDTKEPLVGAKKIEDSAVKFLGDRGPRVDYRLIRDDKRPNFAPLMTIRTAISFKLAGVDKLGLSYGVIESFLELISNEIDDLKATMGVEAILVKGSLLSNRRVFSKISDELSSGGGRIYFE